MKWKAPNSSENDTESNIEFVSLFYPIYDGWQFRPAPPLVNQQSHALAWSISRFKKDGLSDIWNHTNFPNFMHLVGHVRLPKFEIEEINLPAGFRSSHIEAAYFENVQYFLCTDTEKVKYSSYLKCSDELFDICWNSIRECTDYFQSLRLIYHARLKCPTSTTEDVSFQFMPMLNDKLRNNAFVSMVEKFKLLKTDSGSDCGEKSSMKKVTKFFSYNHSFIFNTEKAANVI